MNDNDNYMGDDLDNDLDNDVDNDVEDDSIDAHEYEITAVSNRSMSWRRIEALKEDLWLKRELSDFADWNEDTLR